MKQSKQSESDSDANVEAKISKIRKMREIGASLLELFPKHAPAKKMAEHAKQHGIPEGAARRYRQFAKLYSEKELNKLFGKSRKAGFSLTTTHIRVLIGVKDDARRTTLGNEAVAQKLSISDLRHLAQNEDPQARHRGGRKPDIHRFHNKDDTKLFCERLQQVMTKWHRLLEYLLIPIEKDKTNKKSRTGKNEISDKKIDDLTKALTALQASVEVVEKICKNIRSK